MPPEAGHERLGGNSHPTVRWRVLESAVGGGRRSNRTMAG
ncbi:hypothetical protein CES85_2338 [Ochrobactrum quorumnocens]|uniref:Uncharacterized protein n=1 Tax=Ochrobactrum quorumnocens TaxID=271865 RepID=A0A248UEL3_9HYPH|nr:hypothetical protein CES85_2338 [[Ochrobactrum] quorumnocens]